MEIISNLTQLPDFSSFSQDEIIQEYEKLFEHCQQLKQAQDSDKQKIYELTRNLDTANATNEYLSNELELISSNESTAIEEIKQKHNHEIELLKKNYSELLSDYSLLEKKCEEIEKTNEKLLEDLANSANHSSSSKSPQYYDLKKELYELEKKNLDLLTEIDNFREEVKRMKLENTQKEKNVDILKMEIKFLEESLYEYKNQCEEKSNLLEKAQDKIIELKMELITKQTPMPEDESKKGNSLFAEVDDQRQAMKKLLADQKHNFLEMKKKYKESQYTIRRLKRENSALHTELQVCSTIFLSADKTYKEKLNERINELLKENERLEKKLAWTQDKLIMVSNNHGNNLIDSMLNYCKKETENLQDQLRSLHIQKGLLEEQLRNSREELAKWRFEALKLRCILKHHESLLEEHNIEFESVDSGNVEVKLDLDECQRSTPNITINHKTFEKKPKQISNSEEQEMNAKQKQDTFSFNSSNSQIKTIKSETDETFKDSTTTKMDLSSSNENITMVKDEVEIMKQANISSKLESSIEIERNAENIASNYPFDVYEDTTTNVMQQLATIEVTDNEIREDKENHYKSKLNIPSTSTMNSSSSLLVSPFKDNSNLNKHEIENDVKEPTHSILVKNRGILDFADGRKTVKFGEDGKDDDDETKPPMKKEKSKFNSKAHVTVLQSKNGVTIRKIEMRNRTKNN